MEILATQKSNTRWPPCYGSVVCLSASTSVVVVDLTTMAGHPCQQVNGTDNVNSNPLDHYIDLFADGGDIYFCFGDSVAHLTAVTTTDVTTVSSNALANSFTAKGMWKLTNGTQESYLLHPGQTPAGTPFGASSKVRYLAFATASGTATLRLTQSSQ